MKRSRRKRLKKLRELRKTHRRLLIAVSVFFVMVGVISVAYIVADSIQSSQIGRLVTFFDRGEERVVLTHAKTVRQALDDAQIPIAPQDVVEPSINSELLDTDPAIIIYRSRPVLVIDGQVRQKVVTAEATPRQIVKLAGLDKIGNLDKATFTTGDFVKDGASTILTIKRKSVKPSKVVFQPKPNALTKSKGAQIYVDSDGVAHRETYYDLPMNIVINHCGANNSYTIRAVDGAKVDKDGYVLVAANYGIYPRCSIVETSMGPGKIYDTGGFALRYPHGFDLATDWSYPDGR